MEITQRNTAKIKAVVATILLVLTLIVVGQNTGPVNTKVLFGAFSLPLALLLGLTFASGALVGAILLNRFIKRDHDE